MCRVAFPQNTFSTARSDRPILHMVAQASRITVAVSSLALTILSATAFTLSGNPMALFATVGFGLVSLALWSTILPRVHRCATNSFTSPTVVYAPSPPPVTTILPVPTPPFSSLYRPPAYVTPRPTSVPPRRTAYPTNPNARSGTVGRGEQPGVTYLNRNGRTPIKPKSRRGWFS